MQDEEDTIEATEQSTENQESVPSNPQSICSVCGKLVVPTEVPTKKGIRYHCPECKKFMKPLNPDDLEQQQAEEKKIAPLEIEMTQRVKELLAVHLPKVYGIPAKHSSARITAIIDTLNPLIAMNPFNLHNHIKRYAASADDQHLETIINTVFARLEIEGYKPGIPQQQFVPNYKGQGGMGMGYPLRGYQPPPTYQTYTPQFPTGTNGPQPQRVKVIVDGQEITTDLQGSMAWKKYAAEEKLAKEEAEDRAEQKRQRQETHDLEKQKFQAEIKSLAEGKGSNTETLVEIKVGEQTTKVPASLVPFYLMNQKKADPEVVALKETLNATQQEIKALREEENQKQIADLQGSIAAIAQKMDKQPTFVEQLRSFDELAGLRGFSPTGKTTLDVLSELGKNVDNRANQMLQRMPSVDSFTPDVKRTTNERKQKAASLQQNLDKKEEILIAEDSLVQAASKMSD